MDKGILRKWLKSGFMEKQRLFPTEQGTPQGGIISPVLANMTLDGMEKALETRFRWCKSAAIKNQVNLVRYADDFIITGRTEEHLKEAKRIVIDFLKERGLSLSEEKTRIVTIEQGFDFLGWNIRKYSGKLLIKPAKNNVHKHLQKIRNTIKEMQGNEQKDLIEKLNPIIKGWTNYHANQVSKKVFAKTSHETWKALWKWAKQRHPVKGLKWIKKRYFHREESRDWIFGYKDGNGKWVNLHKHADTHITRHVKVKAEANPFDPTWETYWEERDKQLANRTFYGKVKSLWKRQEGECPICRESIRVGDEFNIHHIIRRTNGGGETLDNLQLLHANCHRQIHANEGKKREQSDSH